MAGKTRRRDAHPSSPKRQVEMPKGHLGLKSSPFAPTDCKLTSQFMVVDHMNAHYKKVNTAKSAIDSGPPKAWLTSQKGRVYLAGPSPSTCSVPSSLYSSSQVRDQARRAALKSDMKRREAWVSENNRAGSRPVSRASSDVARDEMYAMMESLDDYDEVDNIPRKAGRGRDANTTLEVHISDGGPDDPDMALIDNIVADHLNSPSKYHRESPVQPSTYHVQQHAPPRTPKGGHSARARHQEPPRPNSERMSNTVGFGATATLQRNPSTPRSADLLETQSHKFTEEKPFQPRINKTNRQSSLSQFKYYNAPPKPRTSNRAANGSAEVGRAPGGGTQVISRQGPTRSTTPLTESVDWANASIMSRDHGMARTPTGVPPLDISLDMDHMQWLKDQSKMAHLRSTYRTDADGGDVTNAAPHNPLNQSGVTSRISSGEEELKYLEFITEVTNDVLDRGIFTNRVLKQVFHSHIQRRKHDLKVSRMRELLDELRQDLGVPSTDEDHEPGVGLTSTYSRPADDSVSYNNNYNATKTLKFADPPSTYTTNNNNRMLDDMNDLSINESRAYQKVDKSPVGLNGTIGGTFDPLMMTTKKFDMATLRQASRSVTLPRSRSPSPGTGRPPIPKRSGRLRSTSRENSLEDDDFNTSINPEAEDSRSLGSRQDEDLTAYKQPPPAPSAATNFSLSREIEPIQEQSETARTDATSVVNYDEDYEDDVEETARRSPSPPPKPTPRRRQSTAASSATGSPRSPVRSTARSSPQSTARSVEDTFRSGEETARSLNETVKSDIDTVRSEINKNDTKDDDDF